MLIHDLVGKLTQVLKPQIGAYEAAHEAKQQQTRPRIVTARRDCALEPGPHIILFIYSYHAWHEIC